MRIDHFGWWRGVGSRVRHTEEAAHRTRRCVSDSTASNGNRAAGRGGGKGHVAGGGWMAPWLRMMPPLLRATEGGCVVVGVGRGGVRLHVVLKEFG